MAKKGKKGGGGGGGGAGGGGGEEASDKGTDWKTNENVEAESKIVKTVQDVQELTKDVDVEGKKESLLGQNSSATSTVDGPTTDSRGESGKQHPQAVEHARSDVQALENKLDNLKQQLVDLRQSIKNFESEFDSRLDACLKQIAEMPAQGGEIDLDNE
ncbi:hypothetical protein GUITHDRAFT_133092 [Guillardia theta CCMP2712]|uniref:Uncharacterized protein n=1 Tax=Guillardia theta (strain CCMP2712) TaxID=905079 RepID=L1JZ44_GUITC|nr:hypothetical protein GUITHDRAFT_133092 [Guillardia theta CCMP2712]EKX53363.1 hypothetical protein GUITHDRAFT_133092 [Guillardia theta CCMP2712]|eukprot:XP_005840343.1 hypothetical protein GUITHDRAFT_133092 [Guillardia theta CCMP2712]